MRSPGAIALLSLVALGCNVVLGLDDLVADRTSGAGAGGESGGNGSGGEASGASGPTGCSDVCGTEGCGDCPPAPVEIADAGFSIDAMEVSTRQYAAWLNTNPSTAGQVYPCEGNDSFELGVMSADALAAALEPPSADCDGFLANQNEPDLDKAVVCVDWCDAVAYCVWAGGHLCGEIGGDVIDVSRPDQGASNDPERSEWFRACSANGTQTFPYGDTYMAGVCNDTNSDVDHVDAHTECGSGGIVNMSGNVHEWERACTTKNDPPLVDNCVRRGGAFFSPEVDLACALTDDGRGGGNVTGTQPGTPSDNTGFRCCY